MRFLADENLGAGAVRLLRDSGLDVLAVAELAPSIRDADVRGIAKAERAILLTHDSDFGDLVFRRGALVPPGVVYFRRVGPEPDASARLLLALLGREGTELIGRFTVLEPDRVRQRPLPAPN